MKTHVTRGPKRWLFCAATGLMLMTPESLMAQVSAAAPAAPTPSPAKNGNPAAILKNAVQREFNGFYDRSAGRRAATGDQDRAAPQNSTVPKPRRTAPPSGVTTADLVAEPGRIVQVADEAPAEQAGPSAIELELQKLYHRDGRQMPGVMMEASPAARRPAQMPTQVPQSPINEMGDPPQPPPTAGVPPRRSRGVSGFLGRLFGKKQPPAPAPRPQPPAQPVTRPAPVARSVGAPAAAPSTRLAPAQAPARITPPAAQTAARPAESPNARRPVIRTPVVEAVEPDPELELMLPPLQEAQAQPEIELETEAQTTSTAPVDSFPDPFTEMSESEADQARRQPRQPTAARTAPRVEPAAEPVAERVAEPEANPFTGLRLDDEPAEVAETVEPAETQPAAPAATFPTVPPPPWNLDAPEIVENDPETGPLELPPLDGEIPEQRTAESTEETPAPLPLSPAAKVAELQPAPAQPAQPPALDREDDYAAKMRKIAERDGLRGFKGFCPVALRDNRDLIDALAAYNSMFEGKIYHFSSIEAKARFDAEPTKYAPVNGGKDVILLGNSGQEVEGTLEYAVWYKDRLHLFSSQETLETFVQTLNIANEEN